MTNREFLNLLKESVMAKAMTNAYRNGDSDEKNQAFLDEEFQDAKHYLIAAFTWDDTPEGDKFWRDVTDNTENYIGSPEKLITYTMATKKLSRLEAIASLDLGTRSEAAKKAVENRKRRQQQKNEN